MCALRPACPQLARQPCKQVSYGAVRSGKILQCTCPHLYIAHLRLETLFMKVMESLGWQYDAANPLLQTCYREVPRGLPPYRGLGIFETLNGIVTGICRKVNTLSITGTVRDFREGVPDLSGAICAIIQGIWRYLKVAGTDKWSLAGGRVLRATRSAITLETETWT